MDLATPAPFVEEETKTVSAAPKVEAASAAPAVAAEEEDYVFSTTTPAPFVEELTSSAVSEAPLVEAAIAEPAIPEERVVADKAPRVESASVVQQQRKGADYDNERSAKRTGGESPTRLLSVEALRGGSGVDFESVAAVVARPGARTWYQKWFPIIFEERNFLAFGEAKKLVLVKGGCCFIFNDEVSVSPLYAIPLEKLQPVLEDRKKPHPQSITISPEGVKNLSSDTIQTVLLMLGKNVEYQFSFKIQERPSVPKKFMDLFGCKNEVLTEEKAVLLAEVDLFLASQDKKK